MQIEHIYHMEGLRTKIIVLWQSSRTYTLFTIFCVRVSCMYWKWLLSLTCHKEMSVPKITKEELDVSCNPISSSSFQTSPLIWSRHKLEKWFWFWLWYTNVSLPGIHYKQSGKRWFSTCFWVRCRSGLHWYNSKEFSKSHHWSIGRYTKNMVYLILSGSVKKRAEQSRERYWVSKQRLTNY